MIGRWVRRLVRLAAILVFVGWFLVLRPQTLGGPAGWILVAGDSMQPNIHPGSLVVVMRRAEYRVGDVIAYRVPEGDPGAGDNVIHRIIGGDGDAGFVVRGDHTSGPDIWRPRSSDVVGAAWLVVPNGALVMLFLRSPIAIASLAAAFAVYVIMGLLTPSRPARSPDRDAPASAVPEPEPSASS
jgi:signal peptidase